jgi:hypothetical protein
LKPSEFQDAQDTIRAGEWYETKGVETLGNGQWIIPRRVAAVTHHGLGVLPDAGIRRVLDRYQISFPKDSLGTRAIQHIEMQVVAVRIQQRHACRIELHHAPNVCGNRAQDFLKVQLRHKAIVEIQDQFQAVSLTL